jgi:hypothetical protein
MERRNTSAAVHEKQIRAFAHPIASTWTWANMFRRSLRTDSEHRFIYRATGHAIEIANLRYHY